MYLKTTIKMKLPILILVVAVILVSGCTQNQQTPSTTQRISPTQTTLQTSPVSSPDSTETPSVTESPKIESPFDYESLPKYASRYYRYSKEAYDSAIVEGKVVYLYFYASWCPICKESRPKILEAFNKMNFDDVIGFEVHYNDNEVTDEDREITRKYQIPYQHTTIIAKNGEQVFKSLEGLTTEKLIEEIEKARKG